MYGHTRQFAAHHQSIWLDGICRGLLRSGALARYVTELDVTGVTSNPALFEAALSGSNDYDDSIRVLHEAGLSGEGLLYELALEDLAQAADLLWPRYAASGGVDGWVSLEISPLLADSTSDTLLAATQLNRRAAKANLYVTIPGTKAGIAAFEAAIVEGIPVNVTLLFSREHYMAAAQAYMRAIGRRLAAGLDPAVPSVASLFVSRWDVAASKQLPSPIHNRLGIAMAMQAFKAYSDLLASEQWRRLAAMGARPQRLLWVSTGRKDPSAADTMYVSALAGAGTIDTMPEATLLAFADHGEIERPMPVDGGYAEALLGEVRREGLDLDAMAEQLQRAGVAALTQSWRNLLTVIGAKAKQPALAGASACSGAAREDAAFELLRLQVGLGQRGPGQLAKVPVQACRPSWPPTVRRGAAC
jgi:transaldolase